MLGIGFEFCMGWSKFNLGWNGPCVGVEIGICWSFAWVGGIMGWSCSNGIRVPFGLELYLELDCTWGRAHVLGGRDESERRRAESQWIVAARPLCHLQYPVTYLSRLQRILPVA